MTRPTGWTAASCSSRGAEADQRVGSVEVHHSPEYTVMPPVYVTVRSRTRFDCACGLTPNAPATVLRATSMPNADFTARTRRHVRQHLRWRRPRVAAPRRHRPRDRRQTGGWRRKPTPSTSRRGAGQRMRLWPRRSCEWRECGAPSDDLVEQDVEG